MTESQIHEPWTDVATKCIKVHKFMIKFYFIIVLHYIAELFFYIYKFQVQNSIQCASASAWIYAAAKKKSYYSVPQSEVCFVIYKKWSAAKPLKMVQTEASSLVFSSAD